MVQPSPGRQWSINFMQANFPIKISLYSIENRNRAFFSNCRLLFVSIVRNISLAELCDHFSSRRANSCFRLWVNKLCERIPLLQYSALAARINLQWVSHWRVHATPSNFKHKTHTHTQLRKIEWISSLKHSVERVVCHVFCAALCRMQFAVISLRDKDLDFGKSAGRLKEECGSRMIREQNVELFYFV